MIAVSVLRSAMIIFLEIIIAMTRAISMSVIGMVAPVVILTSSAIMFVSLGAILTKTIGMVAIAAALISEKLVVLSPAKLAR